MSTSTLPTVPISGASRIPSAARPGKSYRLSARSQQWWERFGATLGLWAQRIRSRRELSRALHLQSVLGGTSALYDLGGTPGELEWEARKPFWRA